MKVEVVCFTLGIPLLIIISKLKKETILGMRLEGGNNPGYETRGRGKGTKKRFHHARKKSGSPCRLGRQFLH